MTTKGGNVLLNGCIIVVLIIVCLLSFHREVSLEQTAAVLFVSGIHKPKQMLKHTKY